MSPNDPQAGAKEGGWEVSQSLREVDHEVKLLAGTLEQKFSDFRIGDRVKIITKCRDFYFFYEETGKIIENSGTYLGLKVRLDKPRHFEGGFVQKTFGFNPEDLKIIKKTNAKKCLLCGQVKK